MKTVSDVVVLCLTTARFVEFCNAVINSLQVSYFQ